MKTQIIDILGKKYQVQAGFRSNEVEEMGREINNRLRMISLEYPALDRLDVLTLYAIEMNERILVLKQKLQREGERNQKVLKRLDSLEDKIKKEIKNLDNGSI